MVEKRKDTKESKKSRKKENADRNPPIGLTDDDYNLLADKMVEVIYETRQRIYTQNADLIGVVTDLLQTLCVAIKDLRMAVSQGQS